MVEDTLIRNGIHDRAPYLQKKNLSKLGMSPAARHRDRGARSGAIKNGHCIILLPAVV